MRYLQLDALRGFFLIIMALDHFGGIFAKLFYQRVGFVTAAEGFVFLSGIVAGMVYGRYNDRQKLFRKSFKRIVTIYKYHLVAIAILFILANSIQFYRDFWFFKFEAFSDFSLSGFFSALVLLYQPNFTDVLPMYIFFIFLMPFMITLLQMKRWRIYWFCTIFLWLVGFVLSLPDFVLRGSLWGCFPIDFGIFNFLSWQFIFFIGLYYGFKKLQISVYVPKFNIYLLLTASIIVVFFFILRNVRFFGLDNVMEITIENFWSHLIFGGFNLGLGRIVNFIAMSYVVAFLLMKYKSLFRYSWLIVLGQNSIKVYTVHLISLFFFAPIVPIVAKFGILWHALFSLAMMIPLYLVSIKNLPIIISSGFSRKYLSNE